MIKRITDSLTRRLHQFLATNSDNQTKIESTKPRRLLFVFQGRQGYRVGMGQGLYRAEPVFRETAQRCSETVEERLGIKLVDAFDNEQVAQIVQQNEYHSVLVHAITHLSLSELWRSKGVEPQATIGLSLGEATSSYINKILSLEEAMSITQSMAQWDERQLAKGRHIILEVGLERSKELCNKCPVSLEYVIEYGPLIVMAFCASKDVNTVAAFLDSNDITYNIFQRDAAYHTPRFSACKGIMAQDLIDIKPQPTRRKFYSSFGGGLLPSSTFFDADFWYWMVAKPALFNTAFESALEDGYDTILNIGPHPSLEPYLKEAIAKRNKDVLILDSMRDDEPEEITFNRTLETLKELGFVKTPNRQTSAFIQTQPEITAANFNLHSPDVLQNPYPFYEALRAKGSVHFLEQHGFWLVLDYDDVASALKQPHIFSSKPALGLDAVLLGAEPQEHARARQLLSPYFSMQAMTKLTGYVESSVKNLLDEASRKTEFDVVSELAIPLTENVIAHLLGLDEEDVAVLRQRVGANKYQLNYYQTLEEFFADYLKEIEKKSDDNFCNQLLRRGNGNDKFIKEEAASLMKLLWVAGTTTTSMLISTSVFLLLHHPQVMFEIQNDMSFLPLFIEESLRHDAPEQTAWRTTTTETEIAGVKIPKDAEVRLCLAAANRDPKHYTNSESLILKRNPKDHLAFGLGHHYCLGATLARLEARVALEAMLTRFSTLRPMQRINEVRYVQSLHFRALEKLIVTAEGK